MSELEYWSRVLELAAYVVTVAGVPVAIGVFVYEKWRERREREERAFDELDAAYVEFTRLCLEHPDLDVLPSAVSSPQDLSSKQLREEEAILAILISLFERVYLTYENQSTAFRRQQRCGWIMFMKSYAVRPNFRRVWGEIGNQFDERFQRFIVDDLLVP